jgi:hypothetical protein
MNHGNMFERNQSKKKGFSTGYIAYNETILGVAFKANP